jgi:hypothetical protein
MSGSTDHRASGTPEKTGRKVRVFDLTTARQMLTLVERIVLDIGHARQDLAEMLPEQDRLDRQKRILPWPERSRRYGLRDDIAAREVSLQEALAELEHLGVELLNPERGRVGFPTLVNHRKAYFSWQPGEETVQFWHYAGDAERQTIPPGWSKVVNLSFSGSV